MVRINYTAWINTGAPDGLFVQGRSLPTLR